MTEFATDTARCDIFLESLPHSLKDIRREFYLLPISSRDFPNLQALYLQEMKKRAASSARAAELQVGNALYAGEDGQYRGGRSTYRGKAAEGASEAAKQVVDKPVNIHKAQTGEPEAVTKTPSP